MIASISRTFQDNKFVEFELTCVGIKENKLGKSNTIKKGIYFVDLLLRYFLRSRSL
jgi:hypothetical protein